MQPDPQPSRPRRPRSCPYARDATGTPSLFAGSFRPAANCIGGDFILQYSFFYMPQEVGCSIHLIGLAADFAMFLIDELPRVSEIFTAFEERTAKFLTMRSS